MDKDLVYSSEIKNMPFLFLETRRAAQLIVEGKTNIEIMELSRKINVFQLEKERRRKELPAKILIRLNSLSSSLIEVIAHGRDENSKLIVFLSIIKTDRLFLEFMQEIFAEKIASGQNDITDKDFIIYFNNKAQTSETVEKWKLENLEKIRGVYKKILCEAGLAQKIGNDLHISRNICDEEILGKIKASNDEIYSKAMALEE